MIITTKMSVVRLSYTQYSVSYTLLSLPLFEILASSSHSFVAFFGAMVELLVGGCLYDHMIQVAELFFFVASSLETAGYLIHDRHIQLLGELSTGKSLP